MRGERTSQGEMKKKYLPLYEKWIIDGRLPHNGLCNCLREHFWQDLPHELEMCLPDDPHRTYWGYELCADNPELGLPEGLVYSIHYEFTPLRQNILLLMAALNDEL